MNVVVVGIDGAAVAAEVAVLQAAGHRVAGFVGDDEGAAQAMGEELFGSVDDLRLPPPT